MLVFLLGFFKFHLKRVNILNGSLEKLPISVWKAGPPREIWGPGAKFDLGALEILSCSTTKR